MGKRREKMEAEGGEGAQAQNPSPNGEADHRHGLNQKKKTKAADGEGEDEAKKKKEVKTKATDGSGKDEGKKKEEVEEKEGAFLLGEPTFSDLSNGRLRCVETGHELLAKDREAYARTKACRLALIDAAVARKKPPLNMFQAHPTSKSQLVCKLTGATVNKTEEHIWKHVNGKKFLNMLEQKEMEKHANAEALEEETKQSKKKLKSNLAACKKDKKRETHGSDSVTKKPKADSDDAEEPDFWVPPIGNRWDFDNGKDCWDSDTNPGDEADDVTSLDGTSEKDDHETGELTKRTKRMSIAVGPSSFASRKKKVKKASTSPSKQ